MISSKHSVKSKLARKMDSALDTILIITGLAIVVVTLLGVIIWFCLKQKRLARIETVEENYYYNNESEGYNNTEVIDKNDYYPPETSHSPNQIEIENSLS